MDQYRCSGKTVAPLKLSKRARHWGLTSVTPVTPETEIRKTAV
jgi:hypothetical protein